MMKLMTMKQYMKMSKPALIRKITKTLRAMPKKRLAMVCYNITKSKLPRLSLSDRQSLKRIKDWDKPKRKALPYNGRIDKRRKKKRKFSRKQLAAQRLFAKRARAGTLRRR
tara:strand:+ start:165 stop:497 length:333 start_codon:yes stop_codon:yes gene_type:complete